MISNHYIGKIFKLPFPFTNVSTIKARPALAISEPDQYGDIRFVFITTKQTRDATDTLDLPENLLPYESHFHLDKIFFLHKDIIQKELATVGQDLLELVLRKITLIDTRRYYYASHALSQTKPFISGVSRINYAGRVYDENEIVNLVDSSLDFWLTSGRYAASFEQELAEILGVKHCSLTNSGSSANLLAFMALTSPQLGNRQIKKGDEVITVAAGFPTTITPIVQFGAIPVFVDIELPTYNIDCSQLEQALSEKTKAVMLAHTLGNPFDLKKVKAFCVRHELWLIEDNCDALGSKYKLNGEWQYTGTIGDIGTSSFYPPHHITMGEGGAVYTNNILLKRLVESFRDWGRDCWCAAGQDNSCKKRFSQQFGDLPYGYDHKYVYSHFGYNLKVTEMQAAIGCTQLEKLPDFVEARRKNWQQLKDGLTSLEKVLIFPVCRWVRKLGLKLMIPTIFFSMENIFLHL